MFSPATNESSYSRRKSSFLYSPAATNNIPNRHSTATPAPWTYRLSVLARIPPIKKSVEGHDSDPVKPVFVGEFPQVVHDEQDMLLQKRIPGDFSGGMDKETFLAWIICGGRLFVWSYLSTAASRKCVILDIPSSVFVDGEIGKISSPGNNWILSVEYPT